MEAASFLGLGVQFPQFYISSTEVRIKGRTQRLPSPSHGKIAKEVWAHVLQSLQIENVKREQRSEVLEDVVELGPLVTYGGKSSYLVI